MAAGEAPGGSEDGVDFGVAALWGVMEKRELTRARLLAHRHRVGRSRVTVVRDPLVVLGREHRVVDDEVGPRTEAHHAVTHAGQLLPVAHRDLGGQRRGPGDELVLEQDVGERRGIGDVHHRSAVDGQPVGGGDVGMVEARAGHLDVGDLELGRVRQLA